MSQPTQILISEIVKMPISHIRPGDSCVYNKDLGETGRDMFEWISVIFRPPETDMSPTSENFFKVTSWSVVGGSSEYHNAPKGDLPSDFTIIDDYKKPLHQQIFDELIRIVG